MNQNASQYLNRLFHISRVSACALFVRFGFHGKSGYVVGAIVRGCIAVAVHQGGSCRIRRPIYPESEPFMNFPS